MSRLLYTLGLALGLPASVWAEAAAGSLTPTASGYLSQLVGALVLIVIAITALAWFLRRVPGVTPPGAGLIRILAVRSIGARERLLLVQVGSEQLLLAVTAAGVQPLHTLTHPIDPPPEEPWSGDFTSLLERFKTGGRGP